MVSHISALFSSRFPPLQHSSYFANRGPRSFVHLSSVIMGILCSKDNTPVKNQPILKSSVLNFYNYSIMNLMKTSTLCSSENPTHDNYKSKERTNELINADYRRSEVCYLLSLSLFGRYLISLDWWQQWCDTGLWKIKTTSCDTLNKKRSGSQTIPCRKQH